MTAKGAGRGDVRKRERNRLDKAGGGRRPELKKTLEIEREKRKENSGNKLQKKAFLSFIFREKEFLSNGEIMT
jgi:hypothetical protein